MDTRAYIESGVIESYVLGLASADEAAELELLCTQHADIKNAVDEFAALMEANAFNNAVTPPPMVKDKVMLELAGEFEKEEKNIAPVIPISTADSLSAAAPKTMWRYLAAASIILLVGSTALNFYFYSSFKNTDSKYQALLSERNSLQASNDVYRTNMLIVQDTNVQKIDLKTVKPDQYNLATVFWNTKTKEVYLMPSNMAALPSDKQYQLWAIVDGKPVSAGVMGECTKEELCKMTNIANASAFAITIEKRGGAETPNLPSMVVAGAVKI